MGAMWARVATPVPTTAAKLCQATTATVSPATVAAMGMGPSQVSPTTEDAASQVGSPICICPALISATPILDTIQQGMASKQNYDEPQGWR